MPAISIPPPQPWSMPKPRRLSPRRRQSLPRLWCSLPLPARPWPAVWAEHWPGAGVGTELGAPFLELSRMLGPFSSPYSATAPRCFSSSYFKRLLRKSVGPW